MQSILDDYGECHLDFNIMTKDICAVKSTMTDQLDDMPAL
jgi:hypothetical protein